MAKLVRVCRNNEEENDLENNQIPLVIDGDLKMIMEISPNSVQCVDELLDFGNCDDFMRRYENLDGNELAVSFMVTHNEVMSFLSQAVPCVGCRQSVEKLYNHIMKTNQPALEPLHIMQSGVLTIDPSVLKNPLLLHTFLYCRGSKLNEILESIPKCRRNRRCLLHSLETHKSRTPIGCWVDVWEALSQKCQDEVLTISSDTLLDALENHLRKNRFCTECKRKVLKAFGILTGDIEAEKVKGYCPSLYEGLKPCPLHKHVHVPADVEFLTELLEKAEHELSGMRRERHAKSMDTAQEEVLTCLAVFMWERLHHLWQKLRTEEQSWLLLYYLGINTLRRSFEVSVEEKQGMSRLEQVVEEIFEEEKEKKVKREQKRQKKRARRKEKCKYGELASSEMSEDCKASKEGLACDVKNGGENENSHCTVDEKTCEKIENELSIDHKHCNFVDSAIWNVECPEQTNNCCEKWPRKKRNTGKSCSVKESSCSKSICDKKSVNGLHQEGDKPCPVEGRVKCYLQQECGELPLNQGCSKPKFITNHVKDESCSHSQGYNHEVSAEMCLQNGFQCETVDMNHDLDDKHDHLPIDDEEKQLLLSMGWNSDEPCQDDSHLETDLKISIEEIQRFKANQKQLINQRQKLRERLREQFNSLSVSAHASH